MTYLITFSCYGSHLHGDARGSVDRRHNQVGAPTLPPAPALQRFEREEMRESPYSLGEQQRAIVLRAIVEVCSFRQWALLAAHVRRSHVHLVLDLEGEPKRIAGDFKEYASRALNRSGVEAPRRRRWVRGSGVRRLFDSESLERALRYVVSGQGVPMAVYVLGSERAT